MRPDRQWDHVATMRDVADVAFTLRETYRNPLHFLFSSNS
jgi:hypothetical protein